MLLRLNGHSFNNYTGLKKINQSIILKGNQQGQEVVLLEHNWIEIHFSTNEKEFYNHLFKQHVPGQGDSTYIIFPVPIGSEKVRND